MILAASGIEPKLIFVVVAAIVGVVNWLIEKKKKDREAAGGSTPAAPRVHESAPGGGSDEKERLRRFMESLGVPQPPQQQPQRPQPSPAPAATRPRQQPQLSQNRPRPIDPRMQPQRPAVKSRGNVVQKPIRAREPEEMQRAGRIEEAASSIERISGEFGAMNVRVAMDPVKTLESGAHLASGAAGTTNVTERDVSPHVATVRKLLQKPSDLRAAFVVMEILGPPRALQR